MPPTGVLAVFGGDAPVVAGRVESAGLGARIVVAPNSVLRVSLKYDTVGSV